MSAAQTVPRWRQVVRDLRWALRERSKWSSPWRFVAFRCLLQLGLHEKIVFRYAGARFRLFNTRLTLLMFYDAPRWHGAYDLKVLFALLRAGDTVLDIGANVGTHCIPLAKRLGTASQVHAFEPHPRVFGYLCANMQLNRLSNLHLYNYALGETEGEVCFTDLGADDLNRVADLQQNAPTIRVPMRPLDSFECALRPTTLIKVDVEGYELFVLRGAERALANTQLLYIEACDAHTKRYGYTVRDLVEFLNRRGWALYQVELAEHVRLRPIADAYTGEQWQNWLGVRDLQWLQARAPVEVVHPDAP
ncbi:MAG: FkbM family methyltransferase [Armatimonadota bacterium]|nr:FkbM family methyltransferase [Armatimonadota bacterium]